MIKNYLKIALRTLKKDKVVSTINILGLGIGVSICLLLFLWVRNEISYDKFNKNADNIYRVVWSKNLPRVGFPVSETLKREFPQVKMTTNLLKAKLTIKKDNQFFEEDNVIYTDKDFFKVFTVNFIAGNPNQALSEPGSIVLTKKAADKYFPGQDAVGLTITDNTGRIFKVSGIVKAFPQQSHFHFSMLAPLKDLNYFNKRKDQWLSGTVYSYVLLKKGTDTGALAKGLEKYIGDNVLKNASDRIKKFNVFGFQKLTDIHLKSDLLYELEPNGNITYVYTFSFIALFILLLAIVNFTNLSTARSINRLSEIGVRKVLGSRRKQLILQFMTETFVQVVLSFMIALIVTELTLGKFNDFAGSHITFNILSDINIFFGIILCALLISMLAGSYPALYVSGFKPISVLRKQVNLKTGKIGLRRALVIFQFVVSTCLIAGTLIVYKQMNYVKTKNLGFDRQHVLVVNNAYSVVKHYKEFRNALLSNPAIADASLSMYLPGDDFDSMLFEPEQPANVKQSSFTYDMIDNHFVDVLKLKIKQGRNFSPDFSSDSTAFLINEAAAKKLGWSDPIGKTLSFGKFTGKVVGVVDDFNYMSLRTSIAPIIFPYIKWTPKYISIRLNPGDVQSRIQFVKKTWDTFVPSRPFSYSFLDQNYEALYKNEKRMSDLFTLFSALAIIIASLGLLGLASFSVKKRIKEIGIRKILGASTLHILKLLLKEFIILVIIANIIAVPVTLYSMNSWLSDFAYHISIGVSIFLLSAILTVLTAFIVVISQAYKATVVNPVKSLRYE